MVTKSTGPEFFSLKSSRGFSPTTSLAADLSQNFHIDMSPMVSTPRRSLFTSSMFAKVESKECATTPPLIPSSPGYFESMDMSPLPHKTSSFSMQIEVHSPCPTPAGEVDNPLASTTTSSKPDNAEATEFLAPPERKKFALTRPQAHRLKAYSSGNIPKRSESPFLPFMAGSKIGAGSSKLSKTTSINLEDCFGNSPPNDKENQKEKRLSLDNPRMTSMGPPPKLRHALTTSAVIRSGSPIGMDRRRPANPLMRPRKQFRRATSMFESANDIMEPEKEAAVLTSSALQSVMDIDELHQPVLPHFFPDGQPDNIPRITRETLIEILDGKYDEKYNKKMVIDCRFEYEFNGGHIDGACNYNDKDQLAEELFESVSEKTLLIFHCEYSAHRAPLMARHVRQQDRNENAEHYPRLTYPEVYILEGGYSGFFNEHRERCEPQNYVEMDDKNHAYTCEREMGKLKQLRRAKFSRAQTFAFGQGPEDSPTAPSRSTNTFDSMLIDSSPISSGTRRMASY